MAVVVRFAPSPTGALHIGSVRTALFNWLFAKHCGGRFLLRIEDTDSARSTEENKRLIFEILSWLTIDYDGEAVIQSSRVERHRQVALDLVSKGAAYFCYCSQEELNEKKEKAIANGVSYRYDRTCRDSEAKSSRAPVVRLRTDLSGTMIVDDMVQGKVRVESSQLDDFVLLRSDGTPTYMLSVVVDDHDMEVTHVIRGDDHLTNTFKQVQIYNACGWAVPEFAHIPLIYGQDGTKLSKRHGAVSAVDYRNLGYLPEAICNYLLRLGWSHGDHEIISRAEAVEWFDFKNVGKSPSRFDINKLNHLNAHYMKEKPDNELLDYMLPFFDTDISETAKEMIRKGMGSLKERAKTVVDLARAAMIYVSAPSSYDEKCKKFATEMHLNLLKKFVENINNEDLHETAKQISESEKVRLVDIAQGIRAALTGTTASPSVFEIIEIIGRSEAVARIDLFIAAFSKQ
jgi:glutamyl-tRNA synthetase